jgi:hypothetical protein
VSFTRIFNFIGDSVVAVFSVCAEVAFESACVGPDAASLEQAAKKIKTMNKIIRMVII